MELIQSPDTLALEYEVPLWSERHWELIARSFRLIRPSGSRVVYIPLLSETNQGNEQSMVRWSRQADGSLVPDYSLMERYLDIAQEHLGELKLVVFYAWDAYLVAGEERPQVDENAAPYTQQQQRLAQKRWDERQEGLTVTIVDAATGEVEPGRLPLYSHESSRERWAPVYAELRERMRRRGLEDAMALGLATDVQPSAADVALLHEISGGLPWVIHRHPGGDARKTRCHHAGDGPRRLRGPCLQHRLSGQSGPGPSVWLAYS